MLKNTEIQKRIRTMGGRAGYNSDTAICNQCGFKNRSVIAQLSDLKTAPRLDTLERLANGLNCSIEDFLYNRSEADTDLARLIKQLSEYEKAKAAAYLEIMVAEKNKPEQKKVA